MLAILIAPILVSAASIFTASSKLAAKCSAPLDNDCSFYNDCIEASIPCGPKGYSLGFGGRYCQKFRDHAKEFSLDGNTWITKVMKCLQTEMIPVVFKKVPVKTCADLQTFGFNVHGGCYINTGICDLPAVDLSRIVMIIRGEVLNPTSFPTMREVAAYCGFKIRTKAING